MTTNLLIAITSITKRPAILLPRKLPAPRRRPQMHVGERGATKGCLYPRSAPLQPRCNQQQIFSPIVARKHQSCLGQTPTRHHNFHEKGISPPHPRNKIPQCLGRSKGAARVKRTDSLHPPTRHLGMESGGIVPLLKPIKIHRVATRSNRLPNNIAPYVSPEPSFLPMANSDSVREMGKVFYRYLFRY